MNEYYESGIQQEHVIPILVTLTEEEWLEAQSFYPGGVLYYLCVRRTMGDESELEYNSNFGDFHSLAFQAYSERQGLSGCRLYLRGRIANVS